MTEVTIISCMGKGRTIERQEVSHAEFHSFTQRQGPDDERSRRAGGAARAAHGGRGRAGTRWGLRTAYGLRRPSVPPAEGPARRRGARRGDMETVVRRG